MGVILNCLIIWVLTGHLCLEAYSRIVSPKQTVDKDLMLFTSVFAVFANLTLAGVVFGPKIFLAMVRYPFMTPAERDSISFKEGEEDLNIRAVMAHINGDLVYSVGVLIAALVIQYKRDWEVLDPLLTILFSFVVIKITFPVAKESLLAISEANEDPTEQTTVVNMLMGVGGISKITGVRIWSLTGEQKCIAMHVIAKPGSNIQKVQREVESFLGQRKYFYTVVQMWPDEDKDNCRF